MRRSMLLFLLLLWITSAPSYAQKAKDEGWSELLPTGEGRDLVLSSCNTCHNAKVVVQARKNRAAWAKTVNDMIQRGSQLFPEEIDPITTYLSKFFGAEVPKLVNVNTASREEFEKLPNFKTEIVTRILDARAKAGGFKNPEELRRGLGMEKADFEKIQYLLEYSN
jgi:DNA uptake protein ComE-like DNA-binding protein